jgi:hypothetical protein
LKAANAKFKVIKAKLNVLVRTDLKVRAVKAPTNLSEKRNHASYKLRRLS